MFGWSQRFSDNSNLIILVDVQRLHENCKWILCVSNGAKWLTVVNGCGIDSCCSYLNFRYRPCFEQGTPWYSGNYRVYIHSCATMWHDKNTQLKYFLSLYSVLLTLKRLGGVGSIWPPSPCGFSKILSSKERVKPWFFVTVFCDGFLWLLILC